MQIVEQRTLYSIVPNDAESLTILKTKITLTITNKMEHPTNSFPETMPAFSSDNPLQALYLKKKGVERLLTRNAGSTISIDFVKETRKKLERQAIIDRGDKNNTTSVSNLETIPSVDDENRQEVDDFLDLSCDDDSSNLSMDWSLPGGEGTDIRYVYGDSDYYDSERLKKKHTSTEERQRSDSIDTMELIGTQLTCDAQDRVTFNGCTRCV